MFDKLNTITSTLKYHAKQIGTGILITGLGVGAYLGFTSAFGKKSESDSKLEEINENGLISLKNEKQHPLTTQRIEEALSKSTPQSFDSVGKLEELTGSKQISERSKNNRDLDNLDNLQLNYRSKAKRAYPVTSEFRVNTYTANSQRYPAITDLTDGGFVVVWDSYGQDGDGWGVYGQQYNALGNPVPVDSEFQVNTYTTSYQEWPAIASLTDSGFVVVWHSLEQDGDGWGIYGQQYNATGNSVGNEFQVNAYAANSQAHPSIASLTDGGFVVVWMSNGQDGDMHGIYGQRYNAAGNLVGGEFRVNTYTANDQKWHAIASLTDGGFVVAWESYGQDGDGWGVYGQQYNALGNPVNSEFHVNTYTANHQLWPAIASLTDGGFVVVWHSNGQDGSSYGVYGQQYNATGSPVGSEFQVNTYTTNNQQYPAIASLTDGGFVVVWQSNGQDGAGFGIYGQQYNATGSPVGSEFQVNTYTTSNQLNPAITGLTDGGFVVVWENDGEAFGVYGRIFSSDLGIPIIENNNLPISPGVTVILNSNMLSATDPDSNNAALQFTVSNVQYGQFENINNPGVAITTFTQQEIIDWEIQFVHDGSDNPPSYEIVVSDGTFTSTPSIVIVTFPAIDMIPIIEHYTIFAEIGQTVVLTTDMLWATDPDGDDWSLIFTVNNVQCGQFEAVDNPGIAITRFTLQQIANGDVQFIRTGGNDNEACFDISVDDGTFKSSPIPGMLTLMPGKGYAIPIAIAAGAVGAGILATLGLFAYRKRWFSFGAKMEWQKKKRMKERIKQQVKKTPSLEDKYNTEMTTIVSNQV